MQMCYVIKKHSEDLIARGHARDSLGFRSVFFTKHRSRNIVLPTSLPQHDTTDIIGVVDFGSHYGQESKFSNLENCSGMVVGYRRIWYYRPIFLPRHV